MEINECGSLPCQHDGQCIDQEDGFVCNCSHGYYGPTCQSNIDYCGEGVSSVKTPV